MNTNRNKIKWPLIFVLLVFALSSHASMRSSSANKNYNAEISSPDGEIVCKLSLFNGKLSYEMNVGGKKVLQKSNLGLRFNKPVFAVGLDFLNEEKFSNDEVWKPLYGKSSVVHNHYNQLTAEFADQLNSGNILKIQFRLFNDGLAFRYLLPLQDGLENTSIIEEETTFNFAEDYTAWSVLEDIEWANPGPLPISEHNRVKLPITIDAGQDCWLSVNEAALFNYSPPIFTSKYNKLVKTFAIDTVPVSLPFETPWRVIQVAESAAKLVESNILLNLNEPSKIEDTSWIIPGKCMWDWRCKGAKWGDFQYGINEESFKRYIDFAAANRIKYVLYDAAWRGPMKEKMPALIKYANSKGVDVCLYYERKKEWLKTQLEDVIEEYAEWGAKGIKYGFLVREPEVKEKGMTYFVKRGQEIIELCAKYKMTINFHDNIYHPSGDERTYPNILAREYCWANQDHRDAFQPVTAVTVPYVNNLSGGLDITNGFYDLNNLHDRDVVDKKGLNSTVVSETARCMVMWAPMLILADHGDAYNAKADLFEFIKEMPDTWDETLGLDGYPGKFITVARRAGEEWFVATVNNEEQRNLNVALDFLGDGEYEMTVYADAPDTDFKTNKEAYQVSTLQVKKGDNIDVKMAAGGGHCMWIRPITKR